MNRYVTPFILSFLLVASVAIPFAASDHPQEGGVTFDHVGGNEWWVEVLVEHNGVDPDAVNARDEGDSTWHPLELKSWGEWGGSFHIEPGHRVMFQSVEHTEALTSCWFTHPAGEEQCSTDFVATFTTPGGNEWWVEVYVDASQPLAGVDARADGGAWVALELRDWGAWAKSFHVPDGSIVEFRATSESGAVAVSGGYVWPSGEPVGGDTLEGAFGPKASNEWWVETVVAAEAPVVDVDARANGGPWHDLTLRDWGAWAGSFHVPDGSTVEFRAEAGDGRTMSSNGFVWPQADPLSGDTEWPHDGAYVQMEYGTATAGTTYSELDVMFVFEEGTGWHMECSGFVNQDDPFFEFGHLAPPTGTIGGPGDDVSVWVLKDCGNDSVGVTVDEYTTVELHQDGEPVTADALHGSHTFECGCDYNQADWGTQPPRLTYSFYNGGTTTHRSEVIDTNAPV